MMETLDSAIVKVLPEDCKVISIARHGKTNARQLVPLVITHYHKAELYSWSTGLRVVVELLDGKQSAYFVKILDREKAAEFAQGEYESQKALSEHIPENAVHPIAWGTLDDDASKAFFLTSFLNLEDCSPPLDQFLAILKSLHQSSRSPNGKFGFHVTTFYGASPMINNWCDTWEEFFTREFRSNLEYAQVNCGYDEELAKVADVFISTVIPRLLGPLETGGRSIKPTLCHGDLWDGNIHIDLDTRQPVLFDACSFYGHNEMDLQCMRDPRYAIGVEFLAMYKDQVGASEPREAFDDRNALYSMRNDLLTAGMRPQWASLLQWVREEMIRLLAKHPSLDLPWDIETTTEGRGPL